MATSSGMPKGNTKVTVMYPLLSKGRPPGEVATTEPTVEQHRVAYDGTQDLTPPPGWTNQCE